jgi:CheY-like chemotaxis protein
MSKRILVVEDQPDNRQIIRDMLAPTDYEIAEVESGEEALTAIRKATARSHFDGHPIADHGRLHCHEPNQG